MAKTTDFTLQELYTVLSHYKTREGSHRHQLLQFLKSHYKTEKDCSKLKKINVEECVKVLYPPVPKKKKEYQAYLKEYRKKFSSLKSGLNTGFRDLAGKGKNPKRIGINRNNVFGYLPETKDEIIKKLSLRLDILKVKVSGDAQEGKVDKEQLLELLQSMQTSERSELEKEIKRLKEEAGEERFKKALKEGEERIARGELEVVEGAAKSGFKIQIGVDDIEGVETLKKAGIEGKKEKEAEEGGERGSVKEGEAGAGGSQEADEGGSAGEGETVSASVQKAGVDIGEQLEKLKKGSSKGEKKVQARVSIGEEGSEGVSFEIGIDELEALDAMRKEKQAEEGGGGKEGEKEGAGSAGGMSDFSGAEDIEGGFFESAGGEGGGKEGEREGSGSSGGTPEGKVKGAEKSGPGRAEDMLPEEGAEGEATEQGEAGKAEAEKAGKEPAGTPDFSGAENIEGGFFESAGGEEGGREGERGGSGSSGGTPEGKVKGAEKSGPGRAEDMSPEEGVKGEATEQGEAGKAEAEKRGKEPAGTPDFSGAEDIEGGFFESAGGEGGGKEGEREGAGSAGGTAEGEPKGEGGSTGREGTEEKGTSSPQKGKSEESSGEKAAAFSSEEKEKAEEEGGKIDEGKEEGVEAGLVQDQEEGGTKLPGEFEDKLKTDEHLFTDGVLDEGFGESRVHKPLAHMLFIPEGSFRFGCSTDDIAYRPERVVKTEKYYMGEYPITNTHFGRFVEATGYVTEAEIEQKSWVFGGRIWNRVVELDEDGGEVETIVFEKGNLREVEGANWRHPYGGTSSIEDCLEHPVVHVTLLDALNFVKWRSELSGEKFRLPTEYEWERAARGDEGLLYPWGNEWDKTKCNSFESPVNGLSSVESFPDDASPFGMHVMAGSVWEWVVGKERPLSGEELDKLLSAKERKNFPCLKGGSWITSPRNLRSYIRVQYPATMRSNFIGFRCVKEV